MKAIEVVRSRINRNPCHKQKILVVEMNLASRSVLHIFRDDLGVKAYKKYPVHFLNECLKGTMLERSKVLKLLYWKEFLKKKKNYSLLRRFLWWRKNLIARRIECMSGPQTRP